MPGLQHLEQKARFMASTDRLEDSDRVLIGLPFDSTTSFRPGTRHAPYRIREVSEGIEEYSVYQDRSLEEVAFFDAGDIIAPFGNVRECLGRIEATAAFLTGMGKKVFGIGGEHLVSLPLIKACHDVYSDLCVIQFDAHADLRQEYLGEELSHATVMRQVVNFLGEGRLFQLGIRSGTRDEFVFAKENTRLYRDEALAAIPGVMETIGQRPVYITVDIDVLDPAYAPGTGTPEGGGISTRELLHCLHRLGELNVVGFDLVEISPPYDSGDITSILGAKLLREALLLY